MSGDGPNSVACQEQGWAWYDVTSGVFVDPFGDRAQMGRGCFFAPKSKSQGGFATEKDRENLINKNKARPPEHRELRGAGWVDDSVPEA